MTGKRYMTAMAAGLVLAASAGGADLQVPGVFPTIQDAIDAAFDGDRVIIEPGTYFESIDFLGKQIVVRSVDVDPETVVIDATGLGSKVVNFSGVSTSDARLLGVTVTGGDNPIAGGGVNIESGDAKVRKCIIRDNFANTGAGVRVADGSPEIGQCLIYDNTSNGGGAALYLNGTGTPSVINCVIVANSPGAPNAAVATFTTVTMRNTIVGANDGEEMSEFNPGELDVQYSNIEGGWPGTGNTNVLPQFVDAGGRDFRLSAGSPCIDAGDNTALPSGLEQDLAGNMRYRHDPHSPNTGNGSAPLIDMGAYEFIPRVRYVDQTATGANDGLTWEDAYPDLVDAMNDTNSDAGVDELWVAAGTHHPDQGTGDRTMTFELLDGKSWYGGFAGSELWLADSDADANETVLSGAIGASGVLDNTDTLVTLTGDDVTLGGFIVQKAYADSGYPVHQVLGDATIKDCWIRLNESTIGRPIVEANFGLSIVRTRINRNEGGSPVHVFGAVALESSLIAGNTIDFSAAVEVEPGGDALIVNSTIYANTSGAITAGVHGYGSAVTVYNSIIWANDGATGDALRENFEVVFPISTTIEYTTIQGADYDSGGPGTNGVDPEFVDLDGPNDVLGDADDEFGLSPGSHAIDSGRNDVVQGSKDWLGAARFVNDAGMPDSGSGGSPVVDRGAVEFTGTSCAYDCNDDGTVDTADLLLMLGAWGETGGDPTCDFVGEPGGDGFNDVADLLGLLGAWGDC